MSANTSVSTETAALHERVEELRRASKAVLDADHADEVSDEAIAESLYAAARLFSAKTDKTGRRDWPVGEDALTATETVVLVTALLDAADVNIFDMAIWYRRVG